MVSETAHKKWNFEILTSVHNGENELEIERVQGEHPGEPECVVDGRVLGAIAPFRCKSSDYASIPFVNGPSQINLRYR